MSNALLIIALPLIMVVCGLFKVMARRIAILSAILMTAQIPLVIIFCLPAFKGNPYMLSNGFGVDGVGAAFILLTTIAVTAAMIQAAFLLPAERGTKEDVGDRQFGLFYSLFGLFILAMYAMLLAQNLGYLWISLEATTLMSAPLVYYHRNRNSLEATWKYLLLCSVGIAFALFGTVLIFASSQQFASGGTIILSELITRGKTLDPLLLKLGFIFCVLGYGTKAGLFPLHNWLPDAHSEAPAPASAMLSGALLNCAVVAIWRLTQVMNAAGQNHLVQEILITAGSVTVLAAGLMLIRQYDLKRIWAYSSVEHMGLLCLAIGVGSNTVFLLHAVNHTIVKVALFLIAGNILNLYGTKIIAKLGGLLKSAPLLGIMLAAGSFAIAGSPPFGTFISEWLLLRDTLTAGKIWAVVCVIIGLSITFIALTSHVGRVIFGKPSRELKPYNAAWSIVPFVLIVISLVAGVAITPKVLSGLAFLMKGF